MQTPTTKQTATAAPEAPKQYETWQQFNDEAIRWIRDAEANKEANERLQRGYAAAQAM